MVRGDALAYTAGLQPLAYDLALADPPYGQELAAELVRQFARRPFARQLWIEHGAKETLPEAPGQRTRRYGDTVLTMIPAPE